MSTKKLTLLDDGSLNSKDDFRNVFGSWGSDSGGSPVYTKDDYKLLALTLTHTGLGESESFLRKDYSMAVDTATLGPAYLQKIYPDIISEDFEIFEDFATEIQVPAITGEDLQAKVKYEYNFYDKQYEEELMGTTTDIVEILSIYGLASEANQNGTVADQLTSPTADSLAFNKGLNERTGAAEKYKTQMVIGSPALTIGTYEEDKNNFPMFVELQVPHNAEREIANDIQDTLLAAILMRDVIEDANLESRDQVSLNTYAQTDFGMESYSLSTDSIDLLDYWNLDLGAWEFPVALPSDAMFVSNASHTEFLGGTQEELADQDGDYAISIAPFVDVLRGAFDGLIEKHGRTYEEIINGTPAYSEILMFKITKYLTASPNAPVQAFYFYNAGDETSGVQTFIDTQVKYDEEYQYAVTAYCAVVGSKYQYSDVSTTTGEFTVGVRSSIRLYEIPMFSSTGRIVMPPPYYPQSHIEQIKGVTNAMLFSFDTQVGETYEAPLSLTDKEQESNTQLLADETRSFEGQILYRSTSAMSGVQVYRTDIPPDSYEDFKGNLFKTLSTDADLASDLTAGAVAKILKQRTNEKFYYMFRALGPHQETSNPSPVYEVELYSDGGVAYPITRLYELGQNSSKTTTKSMKNLLRITPRITQALVNEQASGLVDENGNVQAPSLNDIVLGLEDEILFGKKFKIRITSKNTGKKMDLNVTFTTEAAQNDSASDPTGFVPPTPDVGDAESSSGGIGGMGAVVTDTSGQEQVTKDFGDSMVLDPYAQQGVFGSDTDGGDIIGGGGGY
tara:strand:- start:1192 stop:3555 length:2364 start_codon:yes stop_codon:yes gene_type:complete